VIRAQAVAHDTIFWPSWSRTRTGLPVSPLRLRETRKALAFWCSAARTVVRSWWGVAGMPGAMASLDRAAQSRCREGDTLGDTHARRFSAASTTRPRHRSLQANSGPPAWTLLAECKCPRFLGRVSDKWTENPVWVVCGRGPPINDPDGRTWTAWNASVQKKWQRSSRTRADV